MKTFLKTITELCKFVVSLFGGGDKPSNTVKIGAMSLFTASMCVGALYSMSMVAEDNEMTRLIVAQLGNAIEAICTLGGYATMAKAGKDGVAAYSSKSDPDRVHHGDPDGDYDSEHAQ